MTTPTESEDGSLRKYVHRYIRMYNGGIEADYVHTYVCMHNVGMSIHI